MNQARPKVRLSRALGIPLTRKCVTYFERRPFDDAVQGSGKTGDSLVSLLERRLDAVVHRSGLARSVYQARQLVAHGHFTVDGKKVDRPSYRLRPGQIVQVRERSRTKPPFQLAAAGAHATDGPTAPYLSVSHDRLSATLIREPTRREVPIICDEQLVVEYYSR